MKIDLNSCYAIIDISYHPLESTIVMGEMLESRPESVNLIRHLRYFLIQPLCLSLGHHSLNAADLHTLDGD